MPNTDNLCMSCMKPIGDAKQCPYCGYHADSPQLSPYLPIRSVVANRYLVGKVLEFNGDGVTYAGWDMTERIAVKVREFLPDAICSRENGETQVRVMQGCERAYTDCYQSFLELWRKLMRLMGLSALISVTDVVEDNGTAYAIYEYTDAVPLRKYLLSTSTGYIPWERARQMFMPALSALGTLHSAGIIHRGLSPQTILVTPDGKLKISGFSIWQARTARGDLNPELFPGYAAIEQYGFEGQQGAWTDIYAFAAGSLPDFVQKWEKPLERADILLNSSHSDDDQLFFAGLLPYYASRGCDIQVVYYTDHKNETRRRHELLNGLWTVGIKYYPVISNFPDYYSKTIEGALKTIATEGYTENDALGFQVEMLRRFKPQVAVSHDFNGEYGHGMHKLNAAMMKRAVEISGDKSFFPETAEKYGVYTPKKLYVHLYGENKIVMDYDTPSEFFGGKTPFEMSKLGFAEHKSQQGTWFK